MANTSKILIVNETGCNPEKLLYAGIHRELPKRLRVLIKYMRRDAKTPYSGVYEPARRFIRVSINRNNTYPQLYQFYTPVYRRDPMDSGRYWRGLDSWYVTSGEALILVVFLHELSHYCDHQDGINMNRKETKADQFSYRSILRVQRETGQPLLIRPHSTNRRQFMLPSQVSLDLQTFPGGTTHCRPSKSTANAPIKTMEQYSLPGI